MSLDMIRCPGCGVVMDLSSFEVRPEQVICPRCNTRSIVPPLVEDKPAVELGSDDESGATLPDEAISGEGDEGKQAEASVLELLEAKPAEQRQIDEGRQRVSGKHTGYTEGSQPSIDDHMNVSGKHGDSGASELRADADDDSKLAADGDQTTALHGENAHSDDSIALKDGEGPEMRLDAFERIEPANEKPVRAKHAALEEGVDSAEEVRRGVHAAQPDSTDLSIGDRASRENAPRPSSDKADARPGEGELLPAGGDAHVTDAGSASGSHNAHAGNPGPSSDFPDTRVESSSFALEEPSSDVPPDEASERSAMSDQPEAAASTFGTVADWAAYPEGVADRVAVPEDVAELATGREGASGSATDPEGAPGRAEALGGVAKQTVGPEGVADREMDFESARDGAAAPAEAAAPEKTTAPGESAAGAAAPGQAVLPRSAPSARRSPERPKRRVLPIDVGGNSEALAFAVIGLISALLAFPPLGLGLCITSLSMNAEEQRHGFKNSHAGSTTAVAVVGIVVNCLVLLLMLVFMGALLVALSSAGRI